MGSLRIHGAAAPSTKLQVSTTSLQPVIAYMQVCTDLNSDGTLRFVINNLPRYHRVPFRTSKSLNDCRGIRAEEIDLDLEDCTLKVFVDGNILSVQTGPMVTEDDLACRLSTKQCSLEITIAQPHRSAELPSVASNSSEIEKTTAALNGEVDRAMMVHETSLDSVTEVEVTSELAPQHELPQRMFIAEEMLNEASREDGEVEVEAASLSNRISGQRVPVSAARERAQALIEKTAGDTSKLDASFNASAIAVDRRITIAAIPNKGKGVVATELIAQGTVILVDKSLSFNKTTADETSEVAIAR